MRWGGAADEPARADARPPDRPNGYIHRIGDLGQMPFLRILPSCLCALAALYFTDWPGRRIALSPPVARSIVGWLFSPLVFLLTAFGALAHDPFDCSSRLIVQPDRIEISVTMGTSAARQLLSPALSPEAAADI